jgi:hypothetical protein
MADAVIGISILLVTGLCCMWCLIESNCCEGCGFYNPPDIHIPPEVEITVSPLAEEV